MSEPVRLTTSTLVGRGSPLDAEIGGEFVLMSLETGRYYGLDPVGSEIWRMIATPLRVDALCARLATEYDASAETIERDVTALLDRLLAEGLIEVRG